MIFPAETGTHREYRIRCTGVFDSTTDPPRHERVHEYHVWEGRNFNPTQALLEELNGSRSPIHKACKPFVLEERLVTVGEWTEAQV